MTDGGRRATKTPASNVTPVGHAQPAELLPYSVELASRRPGDPQRTTCARARMVLARALFDAAKIDFPNEPVLLCRGAQVLDQNS